MHKNYVALTRIHTTSILIKTAKECLEEARSLARFDGDIELDTELECLARMESRLDTLKTKAYKRLMPEH